MNSLVHSPEHTNIDAIAIRATVHCLTGCSIGEILGMVIGVSAGWGNTATIAMAVVLAFIFGYALTLLPLVRAGFSIRRALWLALASDTLSIVIMEIVDNALMLIIPGAMEAHITDMLFWGSMAVSLLVAGAVAFPANRWLIARGRGHALVHAEHSTHFSHNSAESPRGYRHEDRASTGHTHH